MNVGLLITCLTDLYAPQVGLAVVDVLEHFGCRVSFPEGQTCCGQPQYNNGFHADARTLAQRMIAVFEDCPVVVTPSASCCAHIREHYPALLAGDPGWLSRAQAFAAKTYEFVEFLTKVLKVDLFGLALPTPTTAAYHYNCHLRRLDIAPDQPLAFFKQLGNMTFVPMERAEQCCGFGGTFSVKYPHISTAIVEDKLACATAAGVLLMIVNDTGCAMNIAGACHRRDLPLRTRHIAELIAEAIAAPGREAAP